MVTGLGGLETGVSFTNKDGFFGKHHESSLLDSFAFCL